MAKASPTAEATDEVPIPLTLNPPHLPPAPVQEAKVLNDPQVPLYMRLRNRLQSWEQPLFRSLFL